MEDQKKLALGVTASIVLPVVVSGVYYVRTVISERAKRKKIEAWKLENLACIERSRDRLMRIAMDPNYTLEDICRAWHEEAAFLRMVRNQPMY